MEMGQPRGGWDGWSLEEGCRDLNIECRYMGNNKTPEKILIWFHGAGQTGLLDKSIWDGMDYGPDRAMIL
jgi:hypothetical protein